MRAQQLIVLILAATVVAGAAFAGAHLFRQQNLEAHLGALEQEALRIASDLQAWKIAPDRYGGQPAPLKVDMTDWTAGNPTVTVSFAQLGYRTNETCGGYATTVGCYTLAGGAGSPLVITGTTQHSLGSFARLTSPSRVIVQVDGIDQTQIRTSERTLGAY